MPVDVKERSEIPEKYKWDLSVLYADEEAFYKDLPGLDGYLEKLSAYQGRLSESPEKLREFLDLQTEFTRFLEKLFTYASLRRAEDGRNEQAQVMSGRVFSKAVQADSVLSFAEPEILSMPEERLKAFVESEALSPYRKILERLLKRKPHTLSPGEEKVLAGLGEVLRTPAEVEQMLQTIDMTFEPVRDGEGNEVPVTQAGYISLQESPDRVLREQSFKSYYKSFKQLIHTFGAAYAANVKGDAAVASLRHYGSSREMAASL